MADGRQGNGRRTYLTPEVQEKIVNALASGAYFETACVYAGVDRQTGLLWLRRGRGEDTQLPQEKIYINFLNAVEEAQATDEMITLARIKQAGQGGQLISEEINEDPDEIITNPDHSIVEKRGKKRVKRTYTRGEWTADAWRLERKFANRWARKDRIIIELRGHIEVTAQKLAEQYGLDAEAVIAEAERLALGAINGD